MRTIYVDKFTAIESVDTALRIRHHNIHLKIDTTIERYEIQAIVHLKPQCQSIPTTLDAVAIKTIGDQIVVIPVQTEDAASEMLKALGDFWRNEK